MLLCEAFFDNFSDRVPVLLPQLQPLLYVLPPLGPANECYNSFSLPLRDELPPPPPTPPVVAVPLVEPPAPPPPLVLLLLVAVVLVVAAGVASSPAVRLPDPAFAGRCDGLFGAAAPADEEDS